MVKRSLIECNWASKSGVTGRSNFLSGARKVMSLTYGSRHTEFDSSRNADGSYVRTQWIMRDMERPNLPWWYCPECNVACAYETSDERDNGFRAHLKSNICIGNKAKKDQP